MFVARIRIGRRQFANHSALLRFIHQIVRERDFRRRVVLRLQLIIADRIRLGALRCFGMFGVVFVSRLYADFSSDVFRAETIGAARRAINFLAIAQPLILHIVRHAIGIGDFSRQFNAHFRLALDSNATRPIVLRCAVVVVSDEGSCLAFNAVGLIKGNDCAAIFYRLRT